MATTEQILERYPQLAGFINHPELGGILQEAAANLWGPEELQGAIYKTKWYQTTWADARTLEVLKSTDPASYAKRREEASFELRSLFATLGIAHEQNPALLGTAINGYLAHGKDEWWLYDWIGKEITKYPSLVTKQGQLGAEMMKYRELADQYLLSYDDKVFTKFAVNSWRKMDSAEGIESRMRQQAIKRFAHLEDELKRGMTVREVLQPMTNVVAQTLEVSPDSIDFKQPRWRQLLEYRDPDTGFRTMTVSEAERWARRQKEFEYTKGARDEVYSVGRQIIESMGKV